MNTVVEAVTARVVERSRASRGRYLDLMQRQRDAGTNRGNLSCGNLAHGYAAAEGDQPTLKAGASFNIGIVTSFNDVLSAHQPYARYPDQIRVWAREVGATAQVAGGVPAMCDGVTQGQAGMDLSLFSRDVIAMSTAVALSHATFDGALLLGICDKIVPGLLIGALRFGHLPMMLVPGGPMPTGLPNKEKQRVRQLYAEGKVGRRELLEAEVASYHAPGTCTFYGTANSNQMMMEAMGLHIPAASFVNTNTPLRQALTRAAVRRIVEIGTDGPSYRPLSGCIDERAIVNAAVVLLATGGSTNHAIHLPAIARAAGIVIDWEDLDDLSAAVPLVARVYPNGAADVNAFQAAGGPGFVVRTLLDAGLLHRDVMTVIGGSLDDYGVEPRIEGDTLVFEPAPDIARDDSVLRPAATPFQPDGGMRLLEGNLGRAVIKISAVDPSRWTIEAPARVFDTQDAVLRAFSAGEFDRDVVVVVRFQGPRANGMPELHKLTPALGVLQDRGFRVALVTDGRMSGASGKVPAAIHASPEAAQDGPLARLRDGDVIRVDAVEGVLSAPAEVLGRAPAATPPAAEGTGREMFALLRLGASSAEEGASAMLAAAAL